MINETLRQNLALRIDNQCMGLQNAAKLMNVQTGYSQSLLVCISGRRTLITEILQLISCFISNNIYVCGSYVELHAPSVDSSCCIDLCYFENCIL